MNMTLGEIAKLVGGELQGDPDLRITGLNGLAEAQPGELSFVRGGKYLQLAASTRAAAVLMSQRPENCPAAVIVVPQPDLAFAQLLQYCEAHQTRHPQGIHPTAVIGENVSLGQNVALDAQVRIGDDAVIADDVVIYAGSYIGHGAKIGRGTVIYPNVTIREETEVGAGCIIHAGAAIGSDGFGFAFLEGQWVKIPQVGRVVLGDNVEVGSNAAIDRATFGVTQIGDGVKVDNLVQIGHNVQIGAHSAIAGMAGIAGSTIIGKNVRIGPNAGLNGHIEIGDGVSIVGRSGVTKSVESGKTVSGFPAMDHNLDRRVLVAQQQVPELLRRVRQLERQVQALEETLHKQPKND
ncbi:MAG: UDP-3-O-(3-hydroxymyristoyl)glucosamine N-acyltransferase [Candidatus Hydrogenedentes bacterium]|nr:UDP-3-O-(3-hydroxymyristoyl)glucosamine N-acyltransferase [Candidatus Hydrogenedentota bacterium]